ncbi:reprolysin-like metallopeptidase [uncultured Psychroserpens sp.]|uniref:zinc-dependent metalloprotease n=1 Tax=uncultured Psychroserpens sp. TaxID=255436 RepID=UPI00260A79A3|nr:M12 family metallo-peptidase [uncultured Psychroserpens sp.]
MKKTTTQIFMFFFLLIVASSFGQTRDWQSISSDRAINKSELETLDETHYNLFQLDIESFKSKLINAPLRQVSNGQSNAFVQFPDVKGELQNYRVVETQIFSSQDNTNQHPNIKTYLGSRVDDPSTRVRFSVTQLGLNAMISQPGEDTFFIQPATKVSNGQYLLYSKNARINSSETFECLTAEMEASNRSENNTINRDANDQLLRTFRIAISVTQEYTNFWDDGNNANGNNRADALAQVVSTLNRTNEVFEVDMAITFVLVDTADDPAIDLIYSPTFPDPYGGDLNGDLQTNLTAVVGPADYDIGHLFAFGGNNGNAGCIGCVCDNTVNPPVSEGKGSGFSSHSFLDNDGGPYMADFFDIDYVPHEIGHQMGALHTHSQADNNSVNFEPGSGTTIMGYAGITGDNNVQNHSDPYFHYGSINQILNNVATAPNNCAVTTGITNNPPVADAGPNYTIPNGTAFILKGAATDPDGSDALTYTWEQINDGYTTRNDFAPTLTTGPLWRSRSPSTSPNRYMPVFERVLNGQLTESNPLLSSNNTTWETVSTVGRGLTFALTVRDRSEAGGVNQMPQSDFDTMNVTVSGTAGPFAVTSQDSGALWTSGTAEMITWNVAGTTANGINTSNVNILLSTDGGQNFDTVLASNTPNDGSEMITVPNVPAPYCRIMIEAVGNIYYAVNSAEFPLDYQVTTTCTQYASGNIALAIPDGTGANQPGAAITNTINIPDAGSIGEVKVNVDASHTWIGDLVVDVIHPNGTAVNTVWNRTCNGSRQTDFDVIFEDGAPAVACASPTTGTYNPSSPLSIFSGLDSAGDWTIEIQDFFNADTGTLNDWYIEICSTTETPLSVDEFGVNDFVIYPNPNTGEFTIKLNSSSNKDINVNIVDIRGRQIFNNAYESNSDFNQVVTLNNVQSGIYLVTVNDGDRKATKKIVIE